MENKWPHQGEVWINKFDSSSVIIEAMFENDTYYLLGKKRFTCDTNSFKVVYRPKGIFNPDNKSLDKAMDDFMNEKRIKSMNWR